MKPGQLQEYASNVLKEGKAIILPDRVIQAMKPDQLQEYIIMVLKGGEAIKAIIYDLVEFLI